MNFPFPFQLCIEAFTVIVKQCTSTLDADILSSWFIGCLAQIVAKPKTGLKNTLSSIPLCTIATFKIVSGETLPFSFSYIGYPNNVAVSSNNCNSITQQVNPLAAP
ncbi:MAG: hypothetical protein KZQ84_20325 [Candidatus Thiodiazotropha sp. (ex Lucinoma borealis)]|nr:hypothetical protein [Candidatus Thiodiazotropha sp. (ex Lucinoma borealis)]